VFISILPPIFLIILGVLNTDIIDGVCVPWIVQHSYVKAQASISMELTIMFLLPLATMVFSYSRIVYELKRKVRIMVRNNEPANYVDSAFHHFGVGKMRNIFG